MFRAPGGSGNLKIVAPVRCQMAECTGVVKVVEADKACQMAVCFPPPVTGAKDGEVFSFL